MVVPYNPQNSSPFYRDYYAQQSGNGLSVFRGATVQRGRGIGGFFSRILRGAMPLLKSGAKIIGEQMIDSGASIAKDIINGKNLKTTAIQNFSSGGKQLLSSLTRTLNSTTNKRKRKARASSSNNSSKPYKRKRTNKHQNIFR